MGLKIGLVYDLRSEYLAAGCSAEQVAEFDSEETIAAIDSALRLPGHATERIGNARGLCAALVAGRRWDLVFNFCEGLSGRCRESQAPAILELFGVGYTFSDPLVCAATLDKSVAKRLIREAGLATPEFHVVARVEDTEKASLKYPLFVKPLAEGAGKGISGRSRIESPEQLTGVCKDLLRRFAQPVLIEEFLPGREFTVGVLGTGAEARVLGTIEISVRPEAGPAVYSYESKERCEELVEYKSLAHGPLRRKVEDLALACYRVLECRDAGRVDIRCDRRSRPAFVELNPLPGLHPTHSDLPMIATQEGMAYMELIGAIIQSAARRLGLSHET
jgi:D-alanine-D-alanine ligase